MATSEPIRNKKQVKQMANYWRRLGNGRNYASLRIDSDVLAWFKRRGKGYQTHMNAVLREAMLREISKL